MGAPRLVIVLGGAGYIGRRVVARLEAADRACHVVDPVDVPFAAPRLPQRIALLRDACTRRR